jgi:hypothetical protein
MKKIKELQKRKVLSEGRDFGIGFTILNKIKSKFETFLPFTACRDYLNDFSYVEHTKKEIGSIYGYNHKLLKCFEKKSFFYIGVNTLDYNSGHAWLKKEEATTILISNYHNLQLFINKIEDKLGLLKCTTIVLDEDTLIFKVPAYWNKTTALISVYTLIIRCFFNITEEERNNEDVLQVMSNHTCFIDADAFMKKPIIRFYNNIGKVKFHKINYDNLDVKSTNQIHNFGIDGYVKLLNLN